MTAVVRSMSHIATGGGGPSPNDRLLRYITMAVLAGGGFGAIHGAASAAQNIATNNRDVSHPVPLYVGVTAGKHMIYGMVGGPIAPLIAWQWVRNSMNCPYSQFKRVNDAL
jgi:hypothetical protein